MASQTLQRLYASAVLATCLVLGACGGGSGDKQLDDGSTDPNTFSLPKIVVVSVAPYMSIEQALADDDNIDWQSDTIRANAITLAYVAQELRQHLSLLGLAVSVLTPAEASGEGEIVLAILGDTTAQSVLGASDIDFTSLGQKGYAIEPADGDIYVAANTRIGVLYGVYRLLEHIGFAWYDADSVFVPEHATGDIVWRSILELPHVELRGFWIYGDSLLTESYAVWLARNRFNVAARIAPHLRAKLGIREWGGGHHLLQQEFSVPGLFEQHPEWFAVVNGIRRPVASSGTYFNPALGNEDAANFFADRMIARLNGGDLSDVDILNIWPSDTRANLFDQSPAALAIGNETDNLLYFYSVVARRLREAYAAGQLSRLVTVGGISYYLTWNPPTDPSLIADLEDTNYLHVFYLNERSWAGRIDDDLDNRDANRTIMDDLSSWRSIANLDYGLVEYYNYSVYAAVALSDFMYLSENHRLLTSNRRGLFAYMHPLASNPGPRRLTNALLAKLGWKDAMASADAGAGEQVINQFFERRYGEYALEWRQIYELMATSVDNAREIFGPNSLYWLLFQELIWAGPSYSPAETVAFVYEFRTGNVQDLPELPKGFSEQLYRSNFRGLDDSIRLQEAAAVRWQALLSLSIDPAIRERVESDAAWFASTNSRYRLMAATSDFLIAQIGQSDLTASRSQMRAEIEFLESAAVTQDTISPVNQRSFLNLHRLLADSN